MIPAVALAMFMASCGGVKSDAEKVCDMTKEMIQAQKSGDKAKIEALEKEYEPKFKELEQKYPQGKEETKEFEALVKPCMEEVLKSAMGGN